MFSEEKKEKEEMGVDHFNKLQKIRVSLRQEHLTVCMLC